MWDHKEAVICQTLMILCATGVKNHLKVKDMFIHMTGEYILQMFCPKQLRIVNS